MTYKVQINDEVRDATLDETAVIDAVRADVETQQQAAADARAAAASAHAKLVALGLTAAEIAALVG